MTIHLECKEIIKLLFEMLEEIGGEKKEGYALRIRKMESLFYHPHSSDADVIVSVGTDRTSQFIGSSRCVVEPVQGS